MRKHWDAAGRWVLLGLFFGWIFWAGVVPRFRSLGADGSVLTLNISFDEPAVGSRIDDRLAGSLNVPESLQVAAVCRNGPDWMSDITLNNDVVVSTRPEFVRAAELGSSGRFPWELIGDAERNLWNGVHPRSLSTLLTEDGWTAEEVESYLSAREELPSNSARSRFVAYAVATNRLGDGQLRLIDVTKLDAGAMKAFASEFASPTVLIAGSKVAPQGVDPSNCLELISRMTAAPEVARDEALLRSFLSV